MKNKLKKTFEKIGRSPITYIILVSIMLLLIFIPEIFLAFGLSLAVTFGDFGEVLIVMSEIALSAVVLALWISPIFIIYVLISRTAAIVKQYFLLRAIKKALKNNKRDFDVKASLYYGRGLNFGIKATVEGRHSDMNIIFVHSSKRYSKYHFSDPENIEIWSKKLLASGRKYVRVSAVGEWQQKGSIKLPKWNDGENYLIFDREPRDITSDEIAETKFRISGDRLFDTFTLYTKDKFVDYIESTAK